MTRDVVGGAAVDAALGSATNTPNIKKNMAAIRPCMFFQQVGEGVCAPIRQAVNYVLALQRHVTARYDASCPFARRGRGW